MQTISIKHVVVVNYLPSELRLVYLERISEMHHTAVIRKARCKTCAKVELTNSYTKALKRLQSLHRYYRNRFKIDCVVFKCLNFSESQECLSTKGRGATSLI